MRSESAKRAYTVILHTYIYPRRFENWVWDWGWGCGWADEREGILEEEGDGDACVQNDHQCEYMYTCIRIYIHPVGGHGREEVQNRLSQKKLTKHEIMRYNTAT